MPEMGLSGSEGGVALTRHPYPYRGLLNRRDAKDAEVLLGTSGAIEDLTPRPPRAPR